MRSAGAIVIAMGLFGAACASNPARSSAAVPLEIPEPPPRAAMDPVPAVIAEPEPAERPSSAPPPRPAPAASTAPPSSSPTPPAVTAPVVAEGPAEPVRTTPPPELRPAGSAGRTPTAAQVRERLARAKNKLDAIDRRQLNAGKRTDYDSARRFLSQAESAVRANNLLLAESSVDKAETLADGLR